MNRKVTVVIPTFRRPQLLTKCLQALAVQDFDREAYEVIVVSDGPDLGTAHVVESFQGYMHLVFLQLEARRGPAAARNKGWQQSQSPLIVFTDDDCLPDAEWISAHWEAYQTKPYAAFSGRIEVPVSMQPTDFERNTMGLETAEFVTANCALSKETLIRSGGFDENFSMAWREDSDLEFKLIALGIRIVRVEEALVTHPVRKAPWGVSMREQKKGLYDALLYKKFPVLFRQKIRPSRPWKYYLILLSFFAMIAGLIAEVTSLSIIGGLGWLLLTAELIRKRLAHTSREPNHVIEMVATSLVIPFLSIYWQFYGALKYRVLFT